MDNFPNFLHNMANYWIWIPNKSCQSSPYALLAGAGSKDLNFLAEHPRNIFVGKSSNTSGWKFKGKWFAKECGLSIDKTIKHNAFVFWIFVVIHMHTPRGLNAGSVEQKLGISHLEGRKISRYGKKNEEGSHNKDESPVSLMSLWLFQLHWNLNHPSKFLFFSSDLRWNQQRKHRRAGSGGLGHESLRWPKTSSCEFNSGSNKETTNQILKIFI